MAGTLAVSAVAAHAAGGGGRDPFSIWEQIAANAGKSLRAHFAHVGAVGWSLGAGVAITAAEDLHTSDALASFSGIVHPSMLSRARRRPPIFLHSGADNIVPPENARALFAIAMRAHVATALYVYGNGTHNWSGSARRRRHCAGHGVSTSPLAPRMDADYYVGVS